MSNNLTSLPDTARSKCHSPAPGDGGLDAQHLLVFIIPKVGHLSSLLDPRIPHHSVGKARFSDFKDASGSLIVDLQCFMR